MHSADDLQHETGSQEDRRPRRRLAQELRVVDEPRHASEEAENRHEDHEPRQEDRYSLTGYLRRNPAPKERERLNSIRRTKRQQRSTKQEGTQPERKDHATHEVSISLPAPMRWHGRSARR
jgi:hypothetical protein